MGTPDTLQMTISNDPDFLGGTIYKKNTLGEGWSSATEITLTGR